MSDLLAENASCCFDVEAQQSLLQQSSTAAAAAAEADTLISAQTSNSSSTFMSVILLLRSVEIFKGAVFDPNLHITCNSPDESLLPDHHQDSGTATAAIDISADPTDPDILSAHDSASDEHKNNIVELQQIQREKITEIVKKEDLQGLHNIGGVRGAAEALNTDLENGISSRPEISPRKPSQLCQVLVTFLHSFLGACNNYNVFLLSCAAFLSLGFGIKEDGLHTGWYNGAILMLNVLVLVIFTTIHKCLKSMSQKKLESSWQSRGRKIQVPVVREGRFRFVHEIDLEVGDVAFLRKGDRVPADGLYITGQELELEGSIKSTTIDEQNPFLFYGCRVVNGDARMLVTSTGMDTVWGEMMSQEMQYADNKCKFESYLHNLNNCIHITGLLISILIIIVLFLRYTAGKLDDERRFRPDTKGEPTPVRTIMDVFKGIMTGSRGTVRVLTTLLSLSLLGVMEGMVFVIAVAAIVWSRKTLAHRATGRDHQACLKMACVTTICTDKFGGLTEHEQEIDKFYIGEEFVSESSVVASNVLQGLSDGIGTLFLINPSACESEFVPLMSWAEAKLGVKRESVAQQCEIIDYNGCNPLQECCRVLIVKNGHEGYLHCKGPPQDILSSCSYHYDIDGQIRAIDEIKRRLLGQAIGYMEAEATKVIAYACKHVTEFDQASVEPNDLIFLAMISLKGTRTEDTRGAILTLMEGGIRTILASGDDIAVLRTIGEDCGLLTSDSEDLVLTAEEFRGWTEEEKMDKVEKIRILGNCLAPDKILLIKCLREKGQVVALLAQQTIDAPALKQANIGLTYGTWSSEIARECCDISIRDSNCFGFLVNIIENGRCFQENIRKFIQLELIITISSTLINFTATVFLGDAPITTIQLFWLNLVVAFSGGLAILTGPPTKTLMTRSLAVRSSTRLISKAMWRNIAIQASYQTTIFVTLQHKGHVILGTSGGHLKSLIYNGLLLCQMFNKFIAREPEKKNIFSGLFQYYNRWFWVALVLFLVCQAVYAMAETVVGSSPRLNMKLWGVCILVGLVSWVLDLAGKSLSNFAAKRAANDPTLRSSACISCCSDIY